MRGALDVARVVELGTAEERDEDRSGLQRRSPGDRALDVFAGAPPTSGSIRDAAAVAEWWPRTRLGTSTPTTPDRVRAGSAGAVVDSSPREVELDAVERELPREVEDAAARAGLKRPHSSRRPARRPAYSSSSGETIREHSSAERQSGQRDPDEEVVARRVEQLTILRDGRELTERPGESLGIPGALEREPRHDPVPLELDEVRPEQHAAADRAVRPVHPEGDEGCFVRASPTLRINALAPSSHMISTQAATVSQARRAGSAAGTRAPGRPRWSCRQPAAADVDPVTKKSKIVKCSTSSKCVPTSAAAACRARA